MSLIILQDAGITASQVLFEGLNFTLNPGDCVGLVAGNGRGKSTLLRAIAGDGELSNGTITRSRGAAIGMMEQMVPERLLQLSMRDAVLAALPEDVREMEGWRADVALDGLGADETFKARKVGELSGGWQRLTLLARVWVGDPDVLLLDEPTNHLDLEKILMLEDWLQNTARGTPTIVASHDRAFLDSVTNRTLFLRPRGSMDFALPYSKARETLAELDAAAAKQQENELKQAKKLRQQAAKLTNIGINSGSDLLTVKAKQLKERASRIEDAQRELHKERSGAIRLDNRGTAAKVLVGLENTNVTTPGGDRLFSTGKQFIFQGDRIGLLGANGTGKSRFIGLLRRAIGGEDVMGIKPTPSIVLGYADQHLDTLPERETPLHFITSRHHVGDQRARASLADAGFSMEQIGAPIGKLSFGQRSRLGLLDLRLLAPNFYLLDEPTNHIDIPGQEALESEIIEHEASCVLVSHDRQFVRNVCNRFWVVEKGRLEEREDPDAFFDGLG
ncbi:MAG: ABC-F family ATP-binding cassette domain-containing protein [Hyphomicrobiaceae bacterium]|nr:ABC-F family ATP-binding cassette domain-containing protein [Hyphomicrobiaceae bacterium]MCC0023527.1 ABC-F family ATP-binding cassette domain-containing protein [Hyphomicrobiaceae bacterium]